MKISFVLNSINAGGAEAHTLRLASMFAERYAVQVLTLKEADPARALDTGNLRVAHCQGVGIYSQRRWLRAVLEKFETDVVISVNLKPLAMVQSCWNRGHLSALHSFPNLIVRQGLRAGLVGMCWLVASALMAPFVSKVVYVCDTQQRAWRAIPPFVFRPGVVIRNGVEIPRHVGDFDHSGLLKIAMVAAFRREKNHRLLVSALAKLRDMSIPFEATFVGDGPLRYEIEGLVEALGLKELVEFPGSLKECSGTYRWADVTVLPSLSETLPLVIAESMSFATPVVASDVGGNREIVLDGENGLLFPSGDLDALVNCLVTMREHESRKAFGANARRRVVEMFSIEEMFALYERQVIALAQGA